MAKRRVKKTEIEPAPYATRKMRVAEEYLKDLNMTQAMVRAGYTWKNANANGYKMLRDEEFQRILKDAKKDLKDRMHLEVEQVIHGLLREANFEGEGATHAARVQAWTQLGRYLEMFTDKQELSGPGGEPLQFVIGPGISVPGVDQDADMDGDGEAD